MFSTSSQMKYWMFHSQLELDQLRREANHRFISAHYDGDMEDDDPLRNEFFLDPAEETIIRRFQEDKLINFCHKFNPPLPAAVVGTAVAFFKRFYIHNSVMDYHPKDIIYPCVYLACKVEEYYLPIGHFVANMELYDVDEAVDLVLSQELLLMQMLHYHLTVHNPYRPAEGLIIDIKTRCDSINPEEFRIAIEKFLSKSLHSDAMLLYSPSQIALTALYVGNSKSGGNLDSYVANKLLEFGGRNDLVKLTERVQAIRQMVRNIQPVDLSKLSFLEEKLERCRTQENNPCSELYRQRIEELSEIDDSSRFGKQGLNALNEPMDEEDPLGVHCLD